MSDLVRHFAFGKPFACLYLLQGAWEKALAVFCLYPFIAPGSSLVQCFFQY
jgi:hypothetical protein